MATVAAPSHPPVVAGVATIERLGNDLVAMAQCMVIDVEAFPHPSAWFGSRSPQEAVWVAREAVHPRVLGFLAARVRQGTLHAQGLAVDPGCRRRGIGRALLRAAMNSAGELGIAAVVLCVSVTNDAAIALYASEGFIVRRRLRSFYSPRAFGGRGMPSR